MIGVLEGKYQFKVIDILSFDLDRYGNIQRAVLKEGENRTVLKITDGVYVKATYDKDQLLLDSFNPLDEKGNTYDHIPLFFY